MTTPQPSAPADDMDMRALMNDTMTKLGVKTAPLTGIAPTAPEEDLQPKPPLTRQEQLIGAIIGLVLLIMVSILWSRNQAQAPSAPVATTAPASTTAPLPTAPPVAMRFPAYAAPDGVTLGAIEATRAITPTAHYGDGWIQADVAGSGRIWLRASDWPSLAIVGPDLAPTPQELGDGGWPLGAAPKPTPPAPTQCAEAGVPGRMVSVCGTDDLATLQEQAKAKWLAAFGGNIGTVDHPTPQPMPSRATLLSGEEPRP